MSGSAFNLGEKPYTGDKKNKINSNNKKMKKTRFSNNQLFYENIFKKNLLMLLY